MLLLRNSAVGDGGGASETGFCGQIGYPEGATQICLSWLTLDNQNHLLIAKRANRSPVEYIEEIKLLWIGRCGEAANCSEAGY